MKFINLLLPPVVAAGVSACTARAAVQESPEADSVPAVAKAALPADSLDAESCRASVTKSTIDRLTEQDYEDVARELGVEVAAMKAVVEIEAGKTHQGFSEPGKPLVNFDMTMFRMAAQRNGINLAKCQKSHPEVFRKGDRTQSSVNRRLQAAEKIDRRTAIEGTFWGMFQIGGFNWKTCGCKSAEEFAGRMALSEREQLELFAQFLINTGLQKHLQKKNWRSFARGYNGASYARKGYHTRLAEAYRRYR